MCVCFNICFHVYLYLKKDLFSCGYRKTHSFPSHGGTPNHPSHETTISLGDPTTGKEAVERRPLHY